MNALMHSLSSIQNEKNFSFMKNTTYRCGGTAEIAYYPNSVKQASAVYDGLYKSGTDFVVLGNGSNVLASDRNYRGAVISTKNLQGITRVKEDSIFCYAGTTVPQLMKFCEEYGLSGLEYLAGIPATIGGLALMNGGAGGFYLADNVINIMLYNGSIRNFANKKCNFGYKYSIMRDINCLILGVELRIFIASSQKVKENIILYLNKRRGLPKGASCGCVFKNCGNLSAGKIIEEVGLKGVSLGKAFVSSEHANFIINGGTSASDVYNLIKTVKEEVFSQVGIKLEEEVVYIGDF